MYLHLFPQKTLSRALFFSSEQEGDWIGKYDGKYVCVRCGYQTAKKDHAKRHFIRMHAPQQPSTCHVCHKVFRNSFNRDEHRAKEHKITKKMMNEAVPDIFRPM